MRRAGAANGSGRRANKASIERLLGSPQGPTRPTGSHVDVSRGLRCSSGGSSGGGGGGSGNIDVPTLLDTAADAAVAAAAPAVGAAAGTSRRRGLLALVAAAVASVTVPAAAPASASAAGTATAVAAAVVRPELAPDQSSYDPSDPDLRAAAQLLQDALAAPDVRREEALWTEVIDRYGALQGRPWTSDVVGRAYGNRGNARSRQGRFDEALGDFDRAIALCPWSVDPVLNRGVALEAMRRYEEAGRDYESVLAASPSDPSAWNNLGNVKGALGDWEAAADCFGKASELAPSFAFAAANRSLALFQLGRRTEAERQMRALLRRYPDFVDVRAALAAALWADGLEAEAETAWLRVEDPRYRDKAWLSGQRRWPPALVDAMGALLRLESVAGGGGRAAAVGR